MNALESVNLGSDSIGAVPVDDLQTQLDAVAAGPNWGVDAVDALLRHGDALGCSDLHVACLRDRLVVRGRLHGSLFPLASIAGDQRDLIISRLKILARLPAFQKSEPQDGRLEFTPVVGAARLLRVSFLPTIHGENVVIRFPQDEESQALSLDGLGMSPETFEAVRDLLHRQEGTVLLTGPSSSGKTTTMYAMLRWLNQHHGDRMNILTIEDPVERDLGFAGQVQVNTAQGLTFERALRSALRQDPNVLMLGEIRDTETARVTMQAGMSGHLVISTLHAGRASLVFSRLLSMGIEPYLVASAISGAIAQRLARAICKACASGRDSSPSRPQSSASGRDGSPSRPQSPNRPHAVCSECAGAGCAGRIGLFECCRVTETLRELILASAAPGRVAEEAARSQTASLRDEAARCVTSGLIARSEMEFIFAGEEEPA